MSFRCSSYSAWRFRHHDGNIRILSLRFTMLLSFQSTAKQFAIKGAPKAGKIRA